MAFWSSTDIEIKQKSKFLVSFAQSFFLPNVKSVTKPSMEVSNKAFKLLNHHFNYPGIVKWNPITITFVDFNGNNNSFDTAGLLAQMLNNSGYNYPDRSDHALDNANSTVRNISSGEKSSTIANTFGPGIYGKADWTSANKFEQNVVITQLTPDGDVNEVWTLVNPIIKSIKIKMTTFVTSPSIAFFKYP